MSTIPYPLDHKVFYYLPLFLNFLLCINRPQFLSTPTVSIFARHFPKLLTATQINAGALIHQIIPISLSEGFLYD